MANIRGTCNKDDIYILARSCVCARVCVCMRMYVRACVRVLGKRKRGVRTSFSPKRGCTECEFRFYYYRDFVDAWRACVCVLAVGQALETSCSAYKFMYFFKYEFVLVGSKRPVTKE